MAMTTCRECRADVSSEAAACPHCGIGQPGWRDPATQPPQVTPIPKWQPGEPYPDFLTPLPDARERKLGRRKGSGSLRVGDVVRCNVLTDEGVGIVIDYSTDFGRSGGTKLYPRWLVEFSDGRRNWYNGISMTKIRT